MHPAVRRWAEGSPTGLRRAAGRVGARRLPLTLSHFLGNLLPKSSRFRRHFLVRFNSFRAAILFQVFTRKIRCLLGKSLLARVPF